MSSCCTETDVEREGGDIVADKLERVRTTVKSASGFNIAAGVWLIVAPFVLAYTGVTAALWNDILIGLAIAILAWVRVAKPLQNEGASWTNLVLGIWLIIAPFALGYSATTAAMVNDIVVGIIVAALAAWSAISSRAYQPPGREQPMTG